jgi:hypothetical protein
MSKSDRIRWLRDGIVGLVNGGHVKRPYEASVSELERIAQLEARVASLERAMVALAVATQSWSAWSNGHIEADFIWKELVMKSVKDLPGGQDATW